MPPTNCGCEEPRVMNLGEREHARVLGLASLLCSSGQICLFLSLLADDAYEPSILATATRTVAAPLASSQPAKIPTRASYETIQSARSFSELAARHTESTPVLSVEPLSPI